MAISYFLTQQFWLLKEQFIFVIIFEFPGGWLGKTAFIHFSVDKLVCGMCLAGCQA